METNKNLTVIIGEKNAKKLSRFSLRYIAGMNETELQKHVSIPASKKVVALFNIAREFSQERLPIGQKLSCSRDVFNHFHPLLRDEKKEHFYIVLLDNKNIIRSKQHISTGSLSISVVHPREVFKPAVQNSAASVILVHNHPSGDCVPSREDHEITKRLVGAGKLLGIEVLDHLIIGDRKYFSFAETGNLK